MQNHKKLVISIVILAVVAAAVIFLIKNKKSNSGFSETNDVAEESLESTVGYIEDNCLVIKNNSLKKGDKIQVVVLSDPQKIEETRVEGVALAESRCRSSALETTDRFFYQLDPIKEYNGLGILSSSTKTKMNGSYLTVDLDSNGSYEFFSVCTSSEGIHFSVWSGTPWVSQKLWSEYLYLGYDTVPSCPDAQYK